VLKCCSSQRICYWLCGSLEDNTIIFCCMTERESLIFRFCIAHNWTTDNGPLLCLSGNHVQKRPPPSSMPCKPNPLRNVRLCTLTSLQENPSIYVVFQLVCACQIVQHHIFCEYGTELSGSMRNGNCLITWANGNFSRTLLDGVGSLVGVLVAVFVASHHQNGT